MQKTYIDIHQPFLFIEMQLYTTPWSEKGASQWFFNLNTIVDWALVPGPVIEGHCVHIVCSTVCDGLFRDFQRDCAQVTSTLIFSP